MSPLILGVSGAPRSGGNTEVLLEAMLAEARRRGARTEKFFLREKTVNPCVACERCRRHKTCRKFLDDMASALPVLQEAQGLILGSPAYHYNVSAQMKAFIDRLYCFYDFTDDRPRQYFSRLSGLGKKAFVFGVGEQLEDKDMALLLPALSMPLEPLGYEIVGQWLVKGLFEPGRAAGDPELMREAAAWGARLAEALPSTP